MILKDVLSEAIAELSQHEVSEPELSAKILLGDLLGMSHTKLPLFYHEPLSKDLHEKYILYIQRRLLHEPVAYILGKQSFYGRDFFVDSRVLIPRPETEELVTFMLPHASHEHMLLDLGSGSGNIPITLALESTWKKTIGCEKDKGALLVATKNRENHKAHISLLSMDVTSQDFIHFLNRELSETTPKLLCVTVNLPYIPDGEREHMEKDVVDFEPGKALFGGIEGDEILLQSTKNVYEVCRELSQDFFMIHEIDDTLAPQVSEHLEQITFQKWTILHDLQGKPRFLHTQFSFDKM